jgi:multifunctional 2-oxoglutarate metabolism enzyme
VIDMFCYRRHGHNEGDDPSYTQPILYRKIAASFSVATLYSDALVARRPDRFRQRGADSQGINQRLNDIYDAPRKSEQYRSAGAERG